MEYELGKKLEALEMQNGYLANQVEILKHEIVQLNARNLKIMQILEKAIAGETTEKEATNNEPNKGTDDERPDPADNIEGNIPFKRGRGRPRKDEVIQKPITNPDGQ